MSFEKNKPSRRSFLIGLATSAVSIPLIGRIFTGVANAELAKPTDKISGAMKYVEKSPHADKLCKNCAHYQGKDKRDAKGNSPNATAPCALFKGQAPKDEVVAGGYCISWSKAAAGK